MRFDLRIAVALGSIALMLASVPVLTKRPAGADANQSLSPQPVQQAAAVAEIPPPARAPSAVQAAKAAPEAKSEGAAERKVETVRPAPTEASPAQPPVTVLKLVSVRLPKPRPHTVAVDKPADRAGPQVMSTAKANVPLPKARPQNIAALAPVQAKQPAATSNKPSHIAALAHAPLPKPRPQAIARVQQPQPAHVAVAANESPVVADVPMPKESAQGTAVAEEPPAAKRSANPPAVTADAKLANASVDFATANPEVARMPNIGALAVPSVAEFKPPMPKARPSSIDRLILVAEMRKYMGTNPTKRSALWCATFMNMVLNKLGYKGTQSDAARSFVDYGRRIPGPKIGAIAVLTRGPNGGHVGVVSGVDKHGNPIIVSGNHGHRVGVGTYSRSRVLAYVLPTPREFKRAAARFSEHTQRSSQVTKQRSSQVTTQLAARSTPSRAENDVADLPITELLAAITAEHGEGRPGSASLRARASHGRPVTAMLVEFLGRKN